MGLTVKNNKMYQAAIAANHNKNFSLPSHGIMITGNPASAMNMSNLSINNHANDLKSIHNNSNQSILSHIKVGISSIKKPSPKPDSLNDSIF